MASVVHSVVAANELGATTLETGALTVSGADRVVIAFVWNGDASPADPTSVRLGGSGGALMTNITPGGTQAFATYFRYSIWAIDDPTAGTPTVYVTNSAGQDSTGVVAASIQDADYASLVAGTIARGTTTAVSSSVTTTSGDLVIDGAGHGTASQPGYTMSQDGSQTLLQLAPVADLNNFGAIGASSKVASGASTTMSWTISSAPDEWIACSVKLSSPAGGGDPVRGLRTGKLIRGGMLLQGLR